MADKAKNDAKKNEKLYTGEEVINFLAIEKKLYKNLTYEDDEKTNAAKIAQYLLRDQSHNFRSKIASPGDSVIILQSGSDDDTEVWYSFNHFRLDLHFALDEKEHITSINAFYPKLPREANIPVDKTLPYRTLIYELLLSQQDLDRFPSWAMQQDFRNTFLHMLGSLLRQGYAGILFITVHSLQIYQSVDADLADELMDLLSVFQSPRFKDRKFKVKILYLPWLAEDTKGRFSNEDYITIPPLDTLRELGDTGDEDEDENADEDIDEILSELASDIADQVYDPIDAAEEDELNASRDPHLVLERMNLDPKAKQRVRERIAQEGDRLYEFRPSYD